MAYQPKRPLALRDELRINGMHARCATCRACPKVLAVLAAMTPAAPEIERKAGVGPCVLPLAS